MNADETFSHWLKRHRKVHGLTQAELAQRVGCARITIQKIELGQRRPSRQIAERIADALRVSAPERATVLERSRLLPSIGGRRPLSAQPTAFVGRERELEELDTLLADPACRAIALVGPGGIGKTRLAIEIVQRNAAAFEDGAVVVPLMAAASVAQAVFAIAEALGLPIAGPGQPQVQLANYLAPRTFLLLLDNVEQIAGLAQLLDVLSQTAPALKLLLTSRITIHSRWVWTMAIDGLAYPRDGAEVSRHEYPAVQLFVQRARQAGARLDSGGDANIDVYRICRSVEGMPLAIELAAAWMRVMSPAAIAARLTSGLDLLATLHEDVPTRHRSMRAVFEQTWDMLDQTERQVLARLSVFRGGFTVEAGEQVADATPHQLAGLVDKCVLRMDASGRCDMHELVRQYAAAQLDAAGATSNQRDVHSAYFAAYVDRWAPQLRGGDQVGALAAIEAEIDNVRAGWEWAVQHDHYDRIAIYSKDLWCFFELRGWFQQAYTFFGHAVDRLQQMTALDPEAQSARDLALIRGLSRQATFGHRLFDPRHAHGAFQESIALARLHGFQRELIEPLIFLAWMSYSEDMQSEALRYANEVVSISTTYNIPWGIGTGQEFQGISAANAGDWAAAKVYWHRSLHQYRTNHDLRGTSTSCVSLASLALLERNYQMAEDLLAEGLSAAVLLDDKVGLLYVLSCLGALSALEGKATDARRQLGEALAIAKTINSPWLMLDALSGAARLHVLEGRPAAAYELAMMVRQMPVTLSASRPLLEQLCAELDSQLTPEEIAAATHRGLTHGITETAEKLLALWRGGERAIEEHTRPPQIARREASA